jgi:hypothetical protein
MRKLQIIVTFVLALVLAGCVSSSLQPLFTDKDIAFEPALNGTWVDQDGEEQLVFSSWSDRTGYTVIHSKQGNHPASFEARLVQLGDYRFVDLYPTEPAMPNDLYAAHFIGVHSFHRVWLDEDKLRIATLDPDWLRKMISENGLEIGHAVVNDGHDDAIVLTAPTAKLQELVVRYAGDPQAFPEPAEWRRKK